jgi:hypothetical protein
MGWIWAHRCARGVAPLLIEPGVTQTGERCANDPAPTFVVPHRPKWRDHMSDTAVRVIHEFLGGAPGCCASRSLAS